MEALYGNLRDDGCHENLDFVVKSNCDSRKKSKTMAKSVDWLTKDLIFT